MKTWKPVASVLATDAQSASSSGTQLLGMGVSIGLISLAGAAMGALCPLCVVATPALLGAGVLQKARAFVFSRRAPQQPTLDPELHHRQLVAEGALLLDVRSPAEFQRGHLTLAANIPADELRARIADVGTTQRPVVVYCETGARSAQASAVLTGAGYQVRDLGPMASW